MNAPQFINKTLVDMVGGVQIFTVNADYVRKAIDPNFTNWGQHYRQPYIPLGEGWIDADTSEPELPFLTTNLLTQRALMAKGVPYEKALDAGDRAEQAERVRANPDARPPKGTADVVLFRWGVTDDGIVVNVVDGDKVRDTAHGGYDDNFTEGGHDRVYPYIPKERDGQVWIENDAYKDEDTLERDCDLLHELAERFQMAHLGWSYVRAHRFALGAEHYYRVHPQGIRSALAKYGWHSL